MLSRPLRPPAPRRRDQSGFTVLEIMIASSLMMLVLAVVGTSLVSLTNTSTRGEALVANEQSESFVLTQLARDLRGSASLVALATTTPYSSEVEMQEVNPSGGTQQTLEWVYDPVAHTLSRDVVSGGTVISTKVALTPVLNTTSNPVFSYYSVDNTDLVATGATPVTVAECTTRIHVFIQSRVDPGPQPFQESQDIQLRNQLANLEAQQNNPC